MEDKIKDFIKSLSEEERDCVRGRLDELEKRLTEDIR